MASSGFEASEVVPPEESGRWRSRARGGAGPRARGLARRLAAARRAALLDVRRRRPRRLPARPGDPHAPRRAPGSRARGGLAAHGGQARGAGHQPLATADRRLRRGRPRRARVAHVGLARGARAGLRSRGPLGRGAARAQAPGGARAVAQGARALLRADLRGDRVDLHEGQPLPGRGAQELPGALRGDRVRAGVRAPGARAVGLRRRRGRRGADRRAARAPAPVPGLPGRGARPARRLAAARGRLPGDGRSSWPTAASSTRAASSCACTRRSRCTCTSARRTRSCARRRSSTPSRPARWPPRRRRPRRSRAAASPSRAS